MPPASPFSQFLNPKSSLTPGIAGALTLGITGTLAYHFDLSKPWPAIVGLMVSFVFGLGVMSRTALRDWRWPVDLILNSLIIFSVAMGTNGVGEAAKNSQFAASGAVQQDSIGAPKATTNMPFLFAEHAYAQVTESDSEMGWCCSKGKVRRVSSQECTRTGGRLFKTESEATEACEKTGGFFRKWL